MKITGFFNRVVRDMRGDYELSFNIPVILGVVLIAQKRWQS